jgi:indole-3-glycerol phosphate synthase
MADILRKIEAYKRREIAEAKVRMPLKTLERKAREHDPPRGFLRAIERRHQEGRPALIAEIKKASPSKGLIRQNFQPAEHAAAYMAAGAACLSVLTDEPSFQGSPADLETAREAANLPALRKDFLFDPYQAWEARAFGADCILVIMACVDDAVARALNAVAHDLRMDVLAEVHDEEELDRALALETRLIGINNRDLRTFNVTLETTERLAKRVPKDRILVAESGIETHDDILRLERCGVSTFLVGESLMRQHDVEAATRLLLCGETIHSKRAVAAS